PRGHTGPGLEQPTARHLAAPLATHGGSPRDGRVLASSVPPRVKPVKLLPFATATGFRSPNRPSCGSSFPQPGRLWLREIAALLTRPRAPFRLGRSPGPESDDNCSSAY